MQAVTRVATLERPAALTSLFLRYVTGQIAEATWKRLSGFVDGAAFATPQEREAMAAFVNDAVVDLGQDAVKLPTRSEARDVLAETRQA
jgi:hypothetical protein